MKLETSGGDLQGLDSFDWCGMYGPECRGGGDDVITHEKITMFTAVERFQLYSDECLDGWIVENAILGGLGDLEFVRNNAITSWAS